MEIRTLKSLIGGDANNRKSNDFYPTPGYAIDDILNRVKFEGDIWEPSCGNGAISKKLKERGYDNIRSSDLYDYGYGESGIDFMKQQYPCDNIITNPPFNISTKFAIHGLNFVRKKMVLLNKLTFLEGKERQSKLFNQNHLESVYVYSHRINFADENKRGGMLSFAWFVFDKRHNGPANIFWI